MSADLVAVARVVADRWYVTTGATAVGPVDLDLLARGVEAGKVPLEAFVRHEQWRVWKPLREVILPDEGWVPPPSTDDLASLGRPSMPADFLPADATDGAADLREAMALLLTAAVARAGADAAIAYVMEDPGPLLVIAHGAEPADALDSRLSLVDPAVLAAASGVTIVAEPSPGPAGSAVVERLTKLGAGLDGALMIPVRPAGKLVGLLEIGRRGAFRAAEIASVEELVAALVQKLEAKG